jgi:hypothetical protein
MQDSEFKPSIQKKKEKKSLLPQIVAFKISTAH